MNAIVGILNLASSFFDAIFAYMIVKSVTCAKPEFRFKILFSAIFILSVLLVNWLNPSSNPYVAEIVSSMGSNVYSVFRQIFYVLIILILACIAFRGTITVKIFSSVLYVGILEVGEIFTYGVVLLFFPNYLHGNYANHQAIYLFGFFSSYAYYFAVLAIMRNFPARSIGTLSLQQGAILIATPTLSAVVIAHLILHLNSYSGASFDLYLNPSLFFMLLLFFIVTFFKNSIDSQERAKAQAVLSIQVDQFVKEYEALESANESFRRFRHDWNNHMMIIRGLVDANDIRKLAAYIKEVENISPASTTIYTSNIIIDVLLSGAEKRAKLNGIDFSIEAVIPSELNIRMADLCVLVANALDNAYEACLKMKGEQRWIKVRLSYKDSHLFFFVENSYEAKVIRKYGQITTSKKNIELHGIGIKNMDSIAEKYGGHISYSYDGNVFTLKCFLTDQLTDQTSKTPDHA